MGSTPIILKRLDSSAVRTLDLKSSNEGSIPSQGTYNMFEVVFSTLFNFADLHICLILLLNLMVIFLKNPIHSLLCFIFGVINVIAIFIFFEADFIALIFFLVYVGAIAVLFLALIMFLNLSYLFYTEQHSSFLATRTKLLNLFLFVPFLLLSIGALVEIFTISVAVPTTSYIHFNPFGINYLAYLMYEKFSFLIVYSGFLLFFTTILTLVYTTLPRFYSIEILTKIKQQEKIFNSLVMLQTKQNAKMQIFFEKLSLKNLIC